MPLILVFLSNTPWMYGIPLSIVVTSLLFNLVMLRYVLKGEPEGLQKFPFLVGIMLATILYVTLTWMTLVPCMS
jgi:hypothetical protein